MEQHDDDKPVGRILTRREMLALLGGAGAVLVVGTGFRNLDFSQTLTPEATAEATSAVTSCVVKPEMTEGPYFVEEMLNRSDIRIEPSDGSIKAGYPLRLKFRVSQVDANGCTPLEGAQVDIWNCDSLGVYSDVSEAGFDTVGQKWLRGYQVTDENGEVEFITIYPGWYSGRAVHIHFKIRTDPASESGYEFTSQLFFDDDLSDEVFTHEPYDTTGVRDTRNDTDMHYANGGDQLLLTVTDEEFEDMAGYAAVFDIALDLSDEEAGDDDSFSMGGGGGAPGGNPPAGGTPGGRPGATATATNG